MPIDDFMLKLPSLTVQESQRLIHSFDGTLPKWLEYWGDLYNVPPDKRFGSFMTAVDIGYRIAKHNNEIDKLEKLIS